jgi:hypothetical protein
MREILIAMLLAGLLPMAAHAQQVSSTAGINAESVPSSEPDARYDRRQHRQSPGGAVPVAGKGPGGTVGSEPTNRAMTVDRDGPGDRSGRRDHPGDTSSRVRQMEATEPLASIRQRRTGQGLETDPLRRSVRDTAGARNSDASIPRQVNDHNWSGTRDHHRDWSRDWRRDDRYDWRTYRNNHRSIYQLGRYFDPYGWTYRRFAVGYSLRPYYYRSRYWLDDPWMYRLPPAYGSYRWVRYYDDALLVNVRTGFVGDVIHNFFW